MLFIDKKGFISMESDFTGMLIKQMQLTLYLEHNKFTKDNPFCGQMCYLPARGIDCGLESIKTPLSVVEKTAVAFYNLFGKYCDNRCNTKDAAINISYVYMNMTSLPMSVLLIPLKLYNYLTPNY
jgi:hypothetical protein